MGIFDRRKPSPPAPPGAAERRDLPREQLAEAAANPGGSVAEIDATLVDDPNGYVPPEAIVGTYPVGADGRPTGWFVRNPRHGPVQDDFRRLTEPDHWLGWLPDDPRTAVRSGLQEVLTEQVPGSVLGWVKVIAEPTFLTGGLPADDGRVTVVRAGMAVPFALSVQSPAHREVVTGVFSWVAARLDEPGGRVDRTWFDVGPGAASAAGALQERMYFDRA